MATVRVVRETCGQLIELWWSSYTRLRRTRPIGYALLRVAVPMAVTCLTAWLVLVVLSATHSASIRPDVASTPTSARLGMSGAGSSPSTMPVAESTAGSASAAPSPTVSATQASASASAATPSASAGASVPVTTLVSLSISSFGYNPGTTSQAHVVFHITTTGTAEVDVAVTFYDPAAGSGPYGGTRSKTHTDQYVLGGQTSYTLTDTSYVSRYCYSYGYGYGYGYGYPYPAGTASVAVAASAPKSAAPAKVATANLVPVAC